MQTKELIFNSDDFGYSEAFNIGIKKGFLSGILTSTCILANGEAFDNAVEQVLPQIKGIGLGVHLNTIEGKSLTNPTLMTDSEGYFNNGFIALLTKSNDRTFLEQMEKEFRAQIEKVISKTTVDHINSHVHTHAIPKIFELTAKLAVEYGIKNIRTQFETPYIIPNLQKHLTVKYPVNLIKNVLLNTFSLINFKTVKKYNLNTNDYIIGVTYTGYMDESAVLYGLKQHRNPCLTEILIHPTFYEEGKVEKPLNFQEYLITQSPSIKEEIKNLGWKLLSYKDI